MTLVELDRLLSEWKAILDSAAQDVMDLQNLPSHEFLVANPGTPKPKLSGATELRIAPALIAINRLLEDYSVLSNTLQRANDLRGHLPRLVGADQKIREVQSLLTSTSIPAADRGALADRGLAQDGGPRAYTPRQVLTEMQECLRVSRDALVEVDNAWRELDGKLNSATTFLNAHAGDDTGGLMELRNRVASLRSRVITDPLGSNAEFDRDVFPLLLRTRSGVEALEKQRAQLRDSLVHGRDLLNRLAELRDQNQAAFEECKEKIIEHAAPVEPLAQERMEAIAEWFTRLKEKAAQGVTDPVCVGLEKWTASIEQFIVEEERACADNRAPLELRRELRGRLSAMRAKALARGAAEDPKLSELSERASRLLYLRPTPMKEAANLVSLYEFRLNGRAG